MKSLFDQRRLDGQMDMPGTEMRPDTSRPMRGRKQQKPCDIGLFADDADQLDLISWFTEQTEE